MAMACGAWIQCQSTYELASLDLSVATESRGAVAASMRDDADLLRQTDHRHGSRRRNRRAAGRGERGSAVDIARKSDLGACGRSGADGGGDRQGRQIPFPWVGRQSASAGPAIWDKAWQRRSHNDSFQERL